MATQRLNLERMNNRNSPDKQASATEAQVACPGFMALAIGNFDIDNQSGCKLESQHTVAIVELVFSVADRTLRFFYLTNSAVLI